MIAVVDYGMGNLRSVQKAFEKVGCSVVLTREPKQLDNAHAIVLPGVGAFRDCIRNLERLNLIEPVIKSIEGGKPFLGICLGLQVLFTVSEEFGITPGLDLLRGKVIRLPREPSESQERLKIPHMGWNNVFMKREGHLFKDIRDGAFFYFVHSYFVVPEDEKVIVTTTSYGIEFTSCIQKDNVVACQFHPEKSQQVGLQLLRNFSTMG